MQESSKACQRKRHLNCHLKDEQDFGRRQIGRRVTGRQYKRAKQATLVCRREGQEQGYLPPCGWRKLLSHVQLFATPWTIESVEFSRPEYWSGQPFPSPGDLSNPGIECRSPALQADSLPAEPQGKPKNSGVGSLSLLQWIFPTQQSSQGLLHCRQILYQESTSCGFPDGSVVKNLPANSGDTVSIPGMERSPGAGNSK